MFFIPDKESAIVRRLLSLKAPNFNKFSLQQIVELRNDSLWENFRQNISDISTMITNNPDVLLDNEIFNETVRDAIDKALFKEIENREQNGIELATDLILGGFSYVPIAGVAADVISAVRSIAEFQEHRNSWIAFLLRVSRADQ